MVDYRVGAVGAAGAMAQAARRPASHVVEADSGPGGWDAVGAGGVVDPHVALLFAPGEDGVE